MPLLGQQVATAARRADFIRYLRSVGEGVPCITWPWSKLAAGIGSYVRISDGEGGTEGAHRWVWRQLNGPVPAGFEVCHACDNPGCCRPSHLWLGTHAQNIQDAFNKGRAHANLKNHPTGEQHHAAILTNADVYDIRRRFGARNQSALAREYGVSHSAINRIGHRRSWRHLPEEP